MKRIKSIAHLLFSFEGRISCKMWWLAKFAVASVIILLLLFVYWESVFYWLRQIVAILTVPWVWSWYVLDVKRLHDRNRGGWWTLLSSICLGIYLLFFTSYEGAFYIQENPAYPICSIYYLPRCANGFSARKSGGKQIWSPVAVPQRVVEIYSAMKSGLKDGGKRCLLNAKNRIVCFYCPFVCRLWLF